MICYSIIGAGWRSEFYIRLATLCPSIFHISGIYIRNKIKQKEFINKYNVPIFDNIENLLQTDFDFIVSCVNKENIIDVCKNLANKGYYVLTETPFTMNILNSKIQVAEQFHYMPRFQAYKSIISSGIIGQISQVKISCCHDYHAISLIRFLLDTDFEVPIISSIKLDDKVRHYNSRNGLIKNPEIQSNNQTISILKFHNKTAIYDFSFEQYFSEIRNSQISIRGTDGEIINDTCCYYKDNSIFSFKISRNEHGINENLDGMSLVNINGNGKLLYTNPLPNCRLSDEEIAIGTCLLKMFEFVKTGNPFYSPEEASFDYYISDKLIKE